MVRAETATNALYAIFGSVSSVTLSTPAMDAAEPIVSFADLVKGVQFTLLKAGHGILTVEHKFANVVATWTLLAEFAKGVVV